MKEAKSEASSQFLTFQLNQEVYAIDVHNTREVVDYTTITPIPDTPVWVKGVINLRGTVIPVLDIKGRFGMPRGSIGRDSCIVILELGVGEDAQIFGVLADAVREVFELSRSAIEAPPTMGGALASECVSGIGHRGEDVFFILDVSRIFTAREMTIAGAA